MERLLPKGFCVVTEKNENADLKKAGLKITLPRVKILSILESSKQRHFSAEELYKLLAESGDDVGLATVYRVLTQFESAGLVIRHRFETGHAVFELNDSSHHDHMVCTQCARVHEFFDKVIEDRQQEIAKQQEFTITDHYHYLYGICKECAQDES